MFLDTAMNVMPDPPEDDDEVFDDEDFDEDADAEKDEDDEDNEEDEDVEEEETWQVLRRLGPVSPTVSSGCLRGFLRGLTS